MKVLILSLFALFLVALAAGWLRNRSLQKKLKRGEIDKMPGIRKARPDGCCGQHEVCEKESLLAAVSKEIEYYDDEELDAFKGREASGYTAQEIELFEEILSTMHEEEVAGWARSLQLRDIQLPDAVKDEVLLIVGELRK